MAHFYQWHAKLRRFAFPLIGVNQGHLGFLTQVPHDNMLKELAGMFTGKYRPEERILLETVLLRDGKPLKNSLALNDVVISRGGAGQMIEFEVFLSTKNLFIHNAPMA